MKMIGSIVVGLVLLLAVAAPVEADVEDATSIDELVSQLDYNGSSHAQVLRLYPAIFNRVPDVGGAKYWIDVNNQGYGVLQIAGFMAGSEEWATTYNGTSDERFVEVVYSNVLGRGYDQAGYNYWLDLVKGTNDSGGNKDFAKLKRHAMVFYVTANVEFTRRYPFASTAGGHILGTDSFFGVSLATLSRADSAAASAASEELYRKLAADFGYPSFIGNWETLFIGEIECPGTRTRRVLVG